MEPLRTSSKAQSQAGEWMYSVPTEVPAAERARWLAELSEALDHAGRLLLGMDPSEAVEVQVRELHLRIQAARLEIDSLRLSRSLNPRQGNGPERIEFPPWTDATRP